MMPKVRTRILSISIKGEPIVRLFDCYLTTSVRIFLDQNIFTVGR